MEEIENANQQEETSFSFRELIGICIDNWKWIVASVIVCLGLGVYYLLRTPKQYSRSAVILIKDDTNSRGLSSDVSSIFQSMGAGYGQTNVNNELAAIQSPATVMETVKRLGLDMTYFVPGTFHDIELYGKTLPINVRFLGLEEEETAGVVVDLDANGSYTLSKFKRGGTEDREVDNDDDVVKGRLNQIVNTPIGKIIVTPTQYFGSFIGESTKPISVFKTTTYDMTTAVQAGLSVALDNKQASIIDIGYTDRIPDRAVDIINTLIAVYKESWLKDKNQVAVATGKFINKRLGEIEQILGGFDANISSYKSTHLIPDEQSTAELYLQQARDNSKELLDLNTQRAMAEYIRSMLVRDVHSRQLLPANSGIGNTGIESQISSYNTLLMERNSLAANSSTKNPLVEDYDQQLSAMRKAIVQSLNNLVAGIDTQVGHAQATENNTNSRIASVPSQAEYLQSVGRKQKVTEQLYLFLLQKREENELSMAFTAYNVRLISPPFGSMIPVSPKGKMVLLIALFMGLAIPIGILFIRESSNTKLRGRKDLENITIPLIGEIPFAGGKRKLPWQKQENLPHDKIVVAEGQHDVINEAFRVLRTKLEFVVPPSHDSNVILLTSFNVNSGKSFLTSNIAMSLAIKQKRVLIIDCDLRKGATSTLVGSPGMGISYYLSGKLNDASKILYKYTGMDNR